MLVTQIQYNLISEQSRTVRNRTVMFCPVLFWSDLSCVLRVYACAYNGVLYAWRTLCMCMSDFMHMQVSEADSITV